MTGRTAAFLGFAVLIAVLAALWLLLGEQPAAPPIDATIGELSGS